MSFTRLQRVLMLLLFPFVEDLQVFSFRSQYVTRFYCFSCCRRTFYWDFNKSLQFALNVLLLRLTMQKLGIAIFSFEFQVAYLTLSVPQKLKKLDLWDSNNSRTLNIDN